MTDAAEAQRTVSFLATWHKTAAMQHVARIGHRTRPPLCRLAAAILIVGLITAGQAHPRSMESHQPQIAEAAHRFAIPVHWIRAVIVAESAADPTAVSHKGAMGLMQIMPPTWDELRAQHGLGSDPLAPTDNILAGTAYLRQMLDRYGSVALMLAAYNAGPGRVDDHLATGRALPNETVDYVAKLLPELSAAHDGSASLMSRNDLNDPSAATIFVPTGGGFHPNSERSKEQLLHSGATVQPHGTPPAAAKGETTNNPLFVQPNTQQRP